MELGRELIDILKKEAESSGAKCGPESMQTRVYGSGNALLLEAAEEQLTAQAILHQAASPTEAKAQVRQLIDWVKGLGCLDIESRYDDHEFRFSIRYSPQKSRGGQKE
jgi:hypothetical protein